VWTKVMPCVVSVRIGASFGSGVIVTKDGLRPTAGHVSAKPDRDVHVIFHSGKTARAKRSAVIAGSTADSSRSHRRRLALRLWGTPPRPRPATVPGVRSPRRFKAGRTPPVRLGRVLKTTPTALTTDCILGRRRFGRTALD